MNQTHILLKASIHSNKYEADPGFAFLNSRELTTYLYHSISRAECKADAGDYADYKDPLL